MKPAIFIAAVVLAAVSAAAPAQQPTTGASLYCEIVIKPDGKDAMQYPFPLANLKDGDMVRLGTNELGSGVEVQVSYDNSDGYPAVTIDKSDSNSPRSLSVEGSVEHPVELTDVDSKEIRVRFAVSRRIEGETLFALDLTRDLSYCSCAAARTYRNR